MTRKRHNLSYNALRGMCALGIFFSHMSYLKLSDMQFWSSIYTCFLRHGSVCTSFFYVMSGFLAVYTWRKASFRDYMTRKLKKIYPLVFCVLLLAVALDYVMSGNGVISEGVAAGSAQWWINILLGITMLKAFVPLESTFYSFHGPSWYLSGLIVFWVLAYVIVPRIQEEKERNKNSCIGKITAICAIAYGIQAVICILVDAYQLGEIRLWATYVNPWFRIFGECFLGMVIASHMERMKLAENSGGLLKTIALFFALAMIVLRNVMTTSLWNAWIYALPISLLLISFYNDEGKVAGLLKSKPFQFFGDISFELYMTHAFVYEGIPVIAGIVSDPLQSWLVYHAGTRFLITLILSSIFAWIVHLLFTKKIKRVLSVKS